MREMKVQHIDARSALSWHSHEQGYAAIVLSGSYVEAGDGGRRRVSEGHIIVHPPFTGHSNRISERGAGVVNIDLSLQEALSLPGGALEDPIEFLRELREDPGD